MTHVSHDRQERPRGDQPTRDSAGSPETGRDQSTGRQHRAQQGQRCPASEACGKLGSRVTAESGRAECAGDLDRGGDRVEVDGGTPSGQAEQLAQLAESDRRLDLV